MKKFDECVAQQAHFDVLDHGNDRLKECVYTHLFIRERKMGEHKITADTKYK